MVLKWLNIRKVVKLVSWSVHVHINILQFIIIAVYLVTGHWFETFQERGCEDEEILFFSSNYFYLFIIIISYGRVIYDIVS